MIRFWLIANERDSRAAEDGGSIDNAKTILAGVTADPKTVDAVIAEIDTGTVGPVLEVPQSIFLEVGQDVKAGGSATVAGAADDTVQLVGVADFGYAQDSIDATFFL